MSNELSEFLGGSTNLMPAKSAAEAFRQVDQAREVSNDFVEGLEGHELLKFASRTQRWLFGREGEPLGDDVIAVHPGSFRHGWCCWTEGQNAVCKGQEMVPITEPMPLIENLPDWKNEGRVTKQLQFDLQVFEGEFTGTPLRFRSNSYGGVSAVQDLAGAIASRLETGEEEFIVPLIKLSHTTYQHKTWGTLGNPVFKVVSWVNSEGKAEDEAPAPTTRRRSA